MPEEPQNKKEERLCPECRSTISIWATKCKFCSSKVGRPRMREAKLTLKDLGGEAHDTHKVSKHVMSAIGAFRYDEVYANDPDKQEKEAQQYAHHKDRTTSHTKNPTKFFTKIYFIIIVLGLLSLALYLTGLVTPEDIKEFLPK